MRIVLSATPFNDGLVFNPDAFNKALYDSELALTGQGLYSELNGGCDLLSAQNGSTDFELRQEHIQPEQVVKTRYAGNWYALDNFSNVAGTINDADEFGQLRQMAQSQALPGTGVRVYVPFEATAIRWNVSWFWHTARWLGLDDGRPQEATASQTQEIYTMVFLRQPRIAGEETESLYEEIRSLRRNYPQTMFRKGTTSGIGTAEPNPWTSEAAQSSSVNLSYLLKVASTNNPTAKLAAGFYEVFVGFYVKPINAGTNLLTNNNVRYDREANDIQKTVEVYQRLSVGCRNARVVAFR